MKNVLQSTGRINAAGKYLVAFADSAAEFNGEDDKIPTRRPVVRCKQLPILYLLHDTIHHAKHHARGVQWYDSLQPKLKDCLQALVRAASTSSASIHSKHHRRLCDLLQLWEDEKYWEKSFTQELRDVAEGRIWKDRSPGQNNLEDNNLFEERKTPPYIMPSFHGDTLTPFYDLPAGNMMPHISSSSNIPINPQLVKPIQFATGRADVDLVTTVKNFLSDVDSMDRLMSEEVEGIIFDVDELGQGIIRDVSTKEIISAEGYYGWSKGFCQKMKKGENLMESGRGTSNGRSVGESRKPRKRQRRRYSQSSTSRSRSSSEPRARIFSGERYGYVRSRLQSPSSSRSYSPPTPPPPPLPPNIHERSQVPQAVRPSQGRSPPYDPRRPLSFSQKELMPPSSASYLRPSFSPAIPPRPPNYDGVWPPPPPPYSF